MGRGGNLTTRQVPFGLAMEAGWESNGYDRSMIHKINKKAREKCGGKVSHLDIVSMGRVKAKAEAACGKCGTLLYKQE